MKNGSILVVAAVADTYLTVAFSMNLVYTNRNEMATCTAA